MPPAALVGRRRRRRIRFRKEAVYRRRRAVAITALGGVVTGAVVLAPDALNALGTRTTLVVTGLDDGAAVGTAALEGLSWRIRVDPEAQRAKAVVRLDGQPAAVVSEGDDLVWRPPPGLPDGPHRVEVSVRRSFPRGPARREARFTVDTAPPVLEVGAPPGRVPLDQPVELAGSAEPGARVTVDDQVVESGVDGRFTVRFPAPPGAVRFVAADGAGNTTTTQVSVAAAVPVTRAVHVTAHAWADPTLRDGILALVDGGLINAVELDLKDESGVVGYDSQVPLARQIGAAQAIYELGPAVEELHRRHVRVIGRLVAFRDPVLAAASWAAGRRDEVVQTPDGAPYQGYGGFTNFANPAVRQYNIDLAEEAVKAGVDDILYDYVRRPDGPMASMRFPGLAVTPEESIVSFLADTRARLRPHTYFLGASVFGIAATRPTEIAQDVAAISRQVDYVAPMLYPSHWNRGEFGLADPSRSPYDVVARSLAEFRRVMAGTDAKLVPWLQDFSLGAAYGPEEVRAQIRAAADAGVGDWLLWDPAVTYTTAALPRP